MQKSWLNQNINIQTLTERIVKFLENEEFDITVFKEEKGYSIIANNSPKYKIEGNITIQIHGEPNDFIIKIDNEERRKSRFPLLLAAMFGGGYFLLKKLKSDERYIEFTRTFWQNINKILSQIRNNKIKP